MDRDIDLEIIVNYPNVDNLESELIFRNPKEALKFAKKYEYNFIMVNNDSGSSYYTEDERHDCLENIKYRIERNPMACAKEEHYINGKLT